MDDWSQTIMISLWLWLGVRSYKVSQGGNMINRYMCKALRASFNLQSLFDTFYRDYLRLVYLSGDLGMETGQHWV